MYKKRGLAMTIGICNGTLFASKARAVSKIDSVETSMPMPYFTQERWFFIQLCNVRQNINPSAYKVSSFSEFWS